MLSRERSALSDPTAPREPSVSQLSAASTSAERGAHAAAPARRAGRGRTLVVLGNGPSLAGFDFSRFRDFDAIGMNAAYRFWDQIGWYPRYYICLDAVVGESHKDAIERLIREQDRNGIEIFVLRRDLVERMPQNIRNDARVMCFEHLRETSRLFSPTPFTTGSHAALVGAMLGYKRMILMGVDCNYVEKIAGAEDRGNNVLEIKKTPEHNPNYFFPTYQIEGDKYTVPNPISDLHINCWRAVAEVLAPRRISVWNGSATSRVDAVPFRSFDEIELEDRSANFPAGPANGVTVDDSMHAQLQYGRAENANVDEVAVIAKLFGDRTGVRHVLLDIGAHRGSSAAHFNRLGWRILCFEPDPDNREKLTGLFGRSANVSIDPRAVSDRPATGLSFFTSAESSGISGLHAFRDSHRRMASVDVTTVAEIVRENGLSTIDVLKVDVEGFEFPVLKGVPWDLIKPDAIECEFEDSKTSALGYTYRDMAEFLVGLGYALYISEWHPVLRYGIRHDWCRLSKYPAPLLSPQAWGNILAFRVDPGIVTLEQTFRACLQLEDSKDMLAKSPPQEGRPTALSDVAAKPAAAPAGDDLVAVNLTGYLLWCSNFVRRHPAVALGFGLILLALVVGAVLPGAPPYRPLVWILLEALAFGWLLATGIGYAGTLARRADRHVLRHREAMIDALARSQKQVAELGGRIDSTAGQAENTEKALSNKIADLSRLAQETNATAVRAEAAGKALLASAPMYNFGRYRTFNRTLTDEQVELLKTVWGRRLSVPADNKTLGYAAHRICVLESNMHGRLATTIEDIMLRAMVGQAVGQKSVSVLEIGTLFGIGAIAVVDALRREGKAVHLTVIDPLESYYGRSKDIVTGQIVSEEVFRDNLRIAGVPEQDVTIIKSMSTSADAIGEAAKREYDLLIVDGDHSFAGVKGDFENYSPFVRLGGFVIFDDYGANDWPDVKRFVDTEMPNHPRFVPVGSEWRTAVFRVVKSGDPRIRKRNADKPEQVEVA